MENKDTHMQDHDLLIEIKTKVIGLTDEMRLMRDDTKQKVKDLDTSKLNISEHNNFKLELAKEALRVDAELKGLREEDEDLRKEIEKANRYIYMAIGGLAVIQVVIAFVK